jgi:hypothetical protein
MCPDETIKPNGAVNPFNSPLEVSFSNCATNLTQRSCACCGPSDSTRTTSGWEAPAILSVIAFKAIAAGLFFGSSERGLVSNRSGRMGSAAKSAARRKTPHIEYASFPGLRRTRFT